MRKLVLATTTAAVLTAACGTSRQSATTRAVTARPPAHHVYPATRSASVIPAVLLARTAYGPALMDRRGFALYRFTNDHSSTSTCYGPCAAAWPPYLVSRPPSAAGTGARAALLGAVRRRDGRLQVTYAGRPLYYYVGDRRRGEVLCQAVTEFGGTWNVVAPDGTAIR